MLFPVPQISASLLDQLNQVTGRFGLSLSPSQAASLAIRESDILERTGRICFGASIMPQLARTFCDSPHIQSAEWASMLAELLWVFYTLKNETRDQLSDEALLERMAYLFSGAAQGSVQMILDAFLTEDIHDEY